MSLNPGDPRRPLPAGSLIPPSRITVPTDLDQIVDVFNASTRERLAILINEMGIAVAGRRSDVSAILRQLPLSAVAGTKLLDQLVQDNHTLRDTVANSNQFIARINQQKGDLGRVIDAASGAASTAAQEAGNLSQTLIDAPQTLTTARRFLLSAGQTSLDLTPAAAQIGASAGPLNTLLTQVHPFEQAAVPALNKAASVAPELTELAVKGTPIIRQAVPTVSALSKIATLAKPLTHWAGLSVVDLLAAVQGWSSGLQFRDGLGHVFHAELGLSPGLVANLASFGVTLLEAREAGRRRRHRARQADSSAAERGAGERRHRCRPPWPRCDPGGLRPVARSLRGARTRPRLGRRRRLRGAVRRLRGSVRRLRIVEPVSSSTTCSEMSPRPGRSRRSPRRREARPVVVVLIGLLVSAAIGGFIWIAEESYNGLPFISYRSLYASLPNIGHLQTHDEVQIAGVKVGQVLRTSTRNGRALVELQLTHVKPLPVDTQVLVRDNGLLGDRDVELVPGTSKKLLVNGATVSGSASDYYPSLPDTLDLFDAKTRGALGQMIGGLGEGVLGRGTQLNQAIHVGPPSGANLNTVAYSILSRPGAAARLLPATDAGVTALDNARNDLAEMFAPAATTLQAFIDERTPFDSAISQAPSAELAGRRGARVRQWPEAARLTGHARASRGQGAPVRADGAERYDEVAPKRPRSAPEDEGRARPGAHRRPRHAEDSRQPATRSHAADERFHLARRTRHLSRAARLRHPRFHRVVAQQPRAWLGARRPVRPARRVQGGPGRSRTGVAGRDLAAELVHQLPGQQPVPAALQVLPGPVYKARPTRHDPGGQVAMRALDRVARRIGLDPLALLGLVVLVGGTVVWVLTFTNTIPKLFSGASTTVVKADFATTEDVVPNDPVRIKGVQVGTVSGVTLDPAGRGATVAMDVNSSDGPIYNNASAAIYWRTALGANDAISIDPGTVGAGRLGSRPIPQSQTSDQVELDEITRTFHDGARTGLQTIFKQLGPAFSNHTAPAATFSTLAQVAPTAAAGIGALRGVETDTDLKNLVVQAARAAHKVLGGLELNRDDYLAWQRALYERGWGASTGPGNSAGPAGTPCSSTSSKRNRRRRVRRV